MEKPRAPKTYDAFVSEFPKLGEAWEAMRAAEDSGPFDEPTRRLLKLAVAIGSGKELPSARGRAPRRCSAARSVLRLAALANTSRPLVPPALTVCDG